MLKQIWSDNPWIPVLLGIVSVAVGFLLGGLIWGVVGAFVFMAVALVAVANSADRLRRRLSAAGIDPDGQERADADKSDSVAEPSGEHLTQSQAPQARPESEPEPEVDKGDLQFSELFEAGWRGDLDAVQEIGSEYVAAAKDEDERAVRRAQVTLFRARGGDALALPDLRSLSDENPKNTEIVHLLGLALEWANDYEAAAVAMASRAAEMSEDYRVTFLLRASRYRRKAGQAAEAEELGRQALMGATGDKEKSSSLAEIAHALDEQGKSVAGLAHLEEAVRLVPNDTALRFDLAYRYSELGLHELAMYHYDAILSTKPNAGTARNNFAVELEHLRLVFRAFENYQRSAANGETLAHANLAYTYIRIGAQKEAKEVIENARAKENVHPNVFQAEANLERLQHEEATREAEIIERGLKARRAFLAIYGGDTSRLPVGDWRFSPNEVVTFTEDKGVATGQVGDEAARKRFRVKFEAGALKITIRAGAYGWSTRTGWGCLRDGEMVFAVKDDENDRIEVTRAIRDSKQR